MNIRTIGVLAFSSLFVLASNSTEASPAFARRYQTSCITCHSAYPSLNDFGRAFKLNGFQLPEDDEFFIKEEPVELGAAAWKTAWPDGIWPNSIPGSFPLAFQTQFRVIRSAGATGSDGPLTDFVFPTGIGLFAGGALGEDISYWGRLQVMTNGGVEIERAYVAFSNLNLNGEGMFGEEGLWGGLPDNALNIRVGRFEPGALAFSNHFGRMTLAPYNLNGFTVDLNEFALEPALASIEAYGSLFGRVMWTAGISNGTEGSDNSSAKDYYGRLAFKIGGLRFDGLSGEDDEDDEDDEDEEDEDEDEEDEEDEDEDEDDEDEEDEDDGMTGSGFRDDSVTLGVFGYMGVARLDDPLTGLRFDDRFRRFGVDMRLNYWRFNLIGAYMRTYDRNPTSSLPIRRAVRADVLFAELQVEVLPWIFVSGRYEYQNFKGRKDDDQNRAIASVTFLLRANVRLVVEYNALIDDEHNPSNSRDTVMVALDVAL